MVIHVLRHPGRKIKHQLNYAGSALLDGVTDDVVRQANNYSAQQVAVTCWALAKLNISPLPNFSQVHPAVLFMQPH